MAMREIASVPLPILITLMLLFTMTSASHGSINFIERLRNYKNLAQLRTFVPRARREAPTEPTSGLKFKVGNCGLTDFLNTAKNCTHQFYSSIRFRGSTHPKCGNRFKVLQNCMMGILNKCICPNDSFMCRFLSDSAKKEIKNNFLVFFGNEEFWCEKGGLGISSDYLPVGLICQPVFPVISNGCTQTYRRLFNTTSSEERLCKEYNIGKKCLLKAMFQHCSFSRNLRQISEVMVEITADFQPFCKPHERQDIIKLENIITENSCPPSSLADIAFAVDVFNSTQRNQYISMKRIIGGLTNRMNYGWNGIQIAVYQFDVNLRAAIRFGRTPNKLSIQRSLRRMKRTQTTAKDKSRKMTGRSLSSLARGAFVRKQQTSLIKSTPLKSGQRPNSPAICFVLTTGDGNDSVIPAINLMRDRNVHVVFIGPANLKLPKSNNKLTPDVTTKLISTDFSFSDVRRVVDQVVTEICEADTESNKLKLYGASLVEGQKQKSKWNHIQNYLNRFREFDLSLLWELNPLVAAIHELPKPIVGPSLLPSRGTPTEVTIPNQRFLLSEGMDGDGYWEDIPTISDGNNFSSFPTDYNGRGPYFDVVEYVPQYFYS